jgi:transposase
MRTKKREARKKSQRSTAEYNTLPTNVTREEFNTFIKPHLSKSLRQKPTLSYFRIFNHILYVLHTGIQWKNLPEKRVHWSNVYKHFNRWSKDGSFKSIFEGSLDHLAEKKQFNLKALHGDGSNVVAKKGELASGTRDTNTKGVKKPWISRTIQATALLPVLPRE